MPDGPDKGIDLATGIAAKAVKELSVPAWAEVARAAAGGTSRLQEALVRADGLRTFERNHPQDPAEVLRQAGKMGARGLSQQEFDVLRNNLRLDAAGATPPAVIADLEKFALYAEILQKSRETGQDAAVLVTSATIQAELGRLHTTWPQLKEGVLNELLRTEAVRMIMPPELYGLNVDIQREIIEALIAADPRLREAVIGKIRGIIASAESIPTPLTATERATLEGERNALNLKIQAMSDSLVRASGLNANQVTAYIDGRTFDQAVRGLEGDLFVAGGVDRANLGKILTFNDEKKAREQAEQKLAGKQALVAQMEAIELRLQLANRALTPEQQVELVSRRQERDRAQQDLHNVEGRITQITTDLGRSEAEIEAITRNVKRTVYGGEGLVGIQEPGLKETLRQLVEASDRRREVDNKINNPPPLAADKQRERITQQNELTARLENVMAEAISEVLLKRYQDAVELNERKTKAEAQEAAKKGEEDKAKGLRLIEEAKETRWVKFDKDKREFTTDKPQIEADMRYLAANGEEGLKRLFLRELTLPGRAVIALPNRPAGVPGAGAPYTHESMPLDQLTPEQKALLDSIFTQEKDRYLEKLFGDYYASRLGAGGLLGSLAKDIKLSDAEFVRLDRSFGERFQQKVGSSKEAIRTMKRLKESGVNINILGPLWYLLLAMLMGISDIKH